MFLISRCISTKPSVLTVTFEISEVILSLYSPVDCMLFCGLCTVQGAMCCPMDCRCCFTRPCPFPFKDYNGVVSLLETHNDGMVNPKVY